MSSLVGWNIAAFAAAIGLSTSIALVARSAPESGAHSHVKGPAALVPDHSRAGVPSARYARIASASPIADGLLLELCEPDRIVAFTPYGGRSRSFRYAGKPTVRVEDIEVLLALRPDLVLVSAIGDAQPVQRLRDAGLVIFDLGEPHGMGTLLPNIRELADLIQEHERGEELAARLTEEMRTVSADVPQSARRRGMYLSVYGGRLFGGASGTSYDDVLVAAGVLDVAGAFSGWPSYATEEVLEVDPDVVVTAGRMRERICNHAGLEIMRACRTPGGIVEIESSLLSDPGLAMVDAARAVRKAVYGPLR